MGIIALALVASGDLDADFTRPPTWVIVSAALAMAAGTYAGGWRIIRTLGTRIAKIDPPQGFAAQTACASILWTTAHFGYPGLDDPRDLGLGDGRGRDARAARRALGRRGEHPRSPGSSRSRWPASSARSWSSSPGFPAATLIVFVLASLISVGAFAARRWETRRLLPPEALESAPI